MDAPIRARRAVLIVDEAASWRQALSGYLSHRALHVTAVETTTAGREMLRRQHFDAVVLDVDTGGEDGMRLAQELGAEGWPPVLLISARADETDRIVGLELGADDYLSKPFGHGELHARLRAVWRRIDRGSAPGRKVARMATWRVNLPEHVAINDDGPTVDLTQGEAALLGAFLGNPLRVLTRTELLRLTDHDETGVFDRTIDVLVARLRRKLDTPANGPILETVRGRGYRLTAPVVWEPPAG